MSTRAAPARPPRGGSRPPVLVVGFPKAGSTALFGLLGKHPELAGTVEKENWTLYPSIWARRPASEDEIATFLAAIPDLPGRRGLEAAPANVFVHPGTVRQLARVRPGVHVLAVVREPRERLLSAYRFQRRRGLRHRSFARFVAENLEGNRAGVPLSAGMAPGFHVTTGLYGRALVPWHEVFRERLGIVDASSLRPGRSAETLGRLVAWLGLGRMPAADPRGWNVTPRSRRERWRTRIGRPLDDLPPPLERDLARVHAADSRVLQSIVTTATGPVLGLDWLGVPAATP